MRNVFGIKCFGKFYPSRTTTRKLRHGKIPRRNTPYQFTGFFHYSHIGTEIGIENIVSAESSQCWNHFPLCKGTGLSSEFFRYGNTHSRGCLKNDNLIRIGNGRFYKIRIIYFHHSAERTCIGALAAMNTNRYISRAFQGIIIEDGLRCFTSSTTQCTVLTLCFVKMHSRIIIGNRHPLIIEFIFWFKPFHSFRSFYFYVCPYIFGIILGSFLKNI